MTELIFEQEGAEGAEMKTWSKRVFRCFKCLPQIAEGDSFCDLAKSLFSLFAPVHSE
jgi:hypothetical protein